MYELWKYEDMFSLVFLFHSPMRTKSKKKSYQNSFVDSQEMRDKGVAKPSNIKIERRQKPNETQKTYYQVIDSTDHMKAEDWDRVVCVFTTGAEWQFKKWKWQKPIEVFTHVKGFYAKWADEIPKENIKSWNVEILSVSAYFVCSQ